MRCSKAKRYIDLKLDGELNPRHLPILTTHLSACSACRAWQADAAKLQLILANAPAPEPPAWVHAQIMDKVHRLDKVRPGFARRFQLATATAVVAVFFSFWAGAQVGVKSFNTQTEISGIANISVSTLSFGENTLLDSYDSSGDTNE
jgi:predicted anti-sigma-YlaC factor YlaD